MKRTAVVLFNLGGPDKPEAVRPFLVNLFSDPAIIRLPAPLRQLVAQFIAARRVKIAADIYARIGGRSPILANTRMQADALEKALAATGLVKCFIAMRYWHPFTDETMLAVKEFAPDEIVLLPLYPQFSTTTTASSLKSWHNAARRAGLEASAKTICCYSDEPGFIKAMARETRAVYEKAKNHGNPRVLFSAHGLPEKTIKSGDPYQFHCERTAASLAKELDIDRLDWRLCYQSRVGPLAWIKPSTDTEIERAGCDKTPLVIVPIAFACENSETLFEIDILYRDLAARAGVPWFDRVSAVGAAPEFIAGLANLIRRSQKDTRACLTACGDRLCPPGFSGCCNQAE